MKTVKVQIAVAVDPTGEWHASGWDGLAISEAFTYAVECLQPGERRYILTAELEVPEILEVAGQVEETE